MRSHIQRVAQAWHSVLQVSRHRAWNCASAFSMLVMILGLAAWSTEASAYDRYKDDATSAGNCSTCHGDFTDGTSPKGNTFPSDNKHEMHRASANMNTECNLCHTNGDGRNPFIGSSQGTAINAGVGCTGCHGRNEDAGNDGLSAGRGAGLRQHHTNAGISGCSNCHSDASPDNYTPVGEDVVPQYYGTADTLANEPCNPVAQSAQNENWTIGDFEGSDNDGDGLYDLNDPDCAANQAPTSDPNGPYSGTVGESVTFDGSGSSDPEGGVLTYDWGFGDGNTGTGVSPTHIYSTDGTFTVTLTVTDDGGMTDSALTTAEIVASNVEYDLRKVRAKNAKTGDSLIVNISFRNVGSTPGSALAELFVQPRGEQPIPVCEATVTDDPGNGQGRHSFEPPDCSYIFPAIGEYSVEVRLTDGMGTQSLMDIVTIRR